MTQHGADVSHHNVDNLGHSLLITTASNFIDFLYAKCTEGTGYVDPTYARHQTDSRVAGLPFGGYHFAHPELSARSQAAFFWKNLTFRSGDMPPMLDVESAGGESPSQVTQWLLEFIAAFQRPLVLYTGNWFWVPSVDMSDNAQAAELAKLPLWLGPWTAPAKPWDKVTIGQTYNVNVTGLGSVDYDTLVTGTVQDLQDYALGQKPTPTPAPGPLPTVKEVNMTVIFSLTAGKYTRNPAYLLEDGTRTGTMGPSAWTAVNHLAKQGACKLVNLSEADYDAFLKHGA